MKYAFTGTSFTLLGASDSTNSDIVATSKDDSFFIEVKMDNSQSGQFVVLADTNRFYPSLANKNPDNPLNQTILDFMNSKFASLTKPGTNGKPLDLPKNILLSWVINHYKFKGVRFIITQDNKGEFIIFPLEKLDDYFQISATYRVKRSGSSSPSEKNFMEITSLVQDPGAKYHKHEVKKTLVQTTKYSDKQKLIGQNYSYQLNEIDSGMFEIRRLSNTANPNVIFTLKLIGHQQKEDLVLFEQSINYPDK